MGPPEDSAGPLMNHLLRFLAMILLAGPPLASAQPLATAELFNSGGLAAVESGIIIAINYPPSIPTGANVTLFDNVVWTPDMVGQSVFASAASELSYDTFVSLLTDGVNERIGWKVTLFPAGGGAQIGRRESSFFTTHPSEWNGVDLQGYSIGGIELHLNQLSLQVDGDWTSYSWDALLTIYEVPEPAAGSLVVIGALCGWWLSSPWKRRNGVS